MIRIVAGLLLIISIFVALVLFPDVTGQPVRIEMFGWLFETRTGMFILLLLFIYSTYWAVQKLLDLGVNSPRQFWSNFRSGNLKRREQRLQDALAAWIDEGNGNSQKLLKRSKDVIPDWLHEALSIWWEKPTSQPKINDEKDIPLTIALKARLATDPENAGLLSVSERQQYLDTWLAVHPGAPIALQRKAAVLGELGEYAEQVALLEELWNKKKNLNDIKEPLATALRLLAGKDDKNRLEHLRKAQRINPADSNVTIALADALFASGDKVYGKRTLLEYLEQNDAMSVAEKALEIMTGDALASFRSVDKPSYQKTVAGSWLRINLAHKAELTGIADDGLTALLEKSPSARLWNLRGDWHAEKGQFKEAVEAYKKSRDFCSED